MPKKIQYKLQFYQKYFVPNSKKCDSLVHSLSHRLDKKKSFCLGLHKMKSFHFPRVKKMQVIDKTAVKSLGSDVLDTIVYFFNNEFDAIDTLSFLTAEDLSHQCDKMYPSISCLFLIANLLYREYKNHVGLCQLLEYLKSDKLGNLHQTSVCLVYWKTFRERVSYNKLQTTFDQISSKLLPRKVFQLYNYFSNYFMLEYKAKKDSDLSWFEKVFFHFYNASINTNENHALSNLTRDLDNKKYQNGENPYNVFDVYSLAYFFQQAHKKLRRIAVAHIVQLLPNEKNWMHDDLLRILRCRMKVNKQFMEQLDHVCNLLSRFYQSEKMFNFVFQVTESTNPDEFFLDAFNCPKNIIAQQKADIVYFLKQKDMEQKSSKQWLGLFFVACTFREDYSWQNSLLELLSCATATSKPNQWSIFCSNNNNMKQYSEDYNWYLKKCWLLLETPQNLEFHLIEMFVTKQIFTTEDHEMIFSFLYECSSECFDAILFFIHQFIPASLFILFDLIMFYHTCKQLGLDILSAWYILNQQFEKKQDNLTLLISSCLPANSRKTYPELARCLSQRDELKRMFQSKQDKFCIAIDNQDEIVELICQQKTIQKCLRQTQIKLDALQEQRANDIQVTKSINEKRMESIILSLTNCFAKHSHLGKDSYWIRFGYRMQMKYANCRAQEDYEKTQNEINFIYQKKNMALIQSKATKKTVKRKKYDFVKRAKLAAENAKIFAINAARSAKNAKKSFCALLCAGLEQIAEQAKTASKLAFVHERTALKYVTDIETYLIQVSIDTTTKKLQVSVAIAQEAFSKANICAANALSHSQNANIWVEKIRIDLKNDQEFVEIFTHCHMERHVFRTCCLVLMVCNEEMGRDKTVENVTKSDKKFFNKHQQFMLALDYLENARPSLWIQTSDFGKYTQSGLFHEPLQIVCEYIEAKNHVFEFLILNHGCLMDELFNVMNLILKICKSNFFKQFAKIFEKLYPLKNLVFFNDICKLLQASLVRYEKLIHRLRKTIICHDESEVMLALYQSKSDNITKNQVFQEEYNIWAFTHAIPAFMSCETNFIQLMASCWLSTDVYSKRTLFDVLNGVSEKVIEIPHLTVKKASSRCEKVVIEDKTDGLGNCAKMLSFFKLDTQLIVCLLRIFECTFGYCGVSASFLNQLLFLTEVNQKDFNKVVIGQLEQSDCSLFFKEEDGLNSDPYRIIADYCNFKIFEASDDVPQRTNEFIDVLRSTVALLRTEVKCMITQPNQCNRQKIFIFICHLAKVIDRVDMMLFTIRNVCLQEQEALLKLWHHGDFKNSCGIYLGLWIKEFKIPVGLQRLNDFIVSMTTIEWVKDDLKGNLIDILNESVSTSLTYDV